MPNNHRESVPIPTSESQRKLVTTSDSDSTGSDVSSHINGLEPNMNPSGNTVLTGLHDETSSTQLNRASVFTIFVLCFVNLINYMDRFTIAGVLTDIQDHFKIGDDSGGLLQTAFVLSYMVFAPLFGFLGDRYSRKYIMILGVALWSLTTLLGSYMDNFTWFVTFRALVGIGEASYSTIAPTIISDLFILDMRTKMLTAFYFAIPVGSGLGYIIGSETANAMGSWRWALRVTPVLGLIAVILIYFCTEPQRGQNEGSNVTESDSTFKDDVSALTKNKTFMLTTFGFTCVAFVTGALAWWAPKFIHLGMQLTPGNENVTLNEVSFRFGLITMLSGIVGVPLGGKLSQILSKRIKKGDAYICGAGLLISCCFFTPAILIVNQNSIVTYILIFCGSVSMNLNWAIVADIVLYVVPPLRRSTAEAFQILISHALGDAGSPYLVGMISEALKKRYRTSDNFNADKSLESLSLLAENTTIAINSTVTSLTKVGQDSIENQFRALQYALFSTPFIELLGAIFFLLASFYIIADRNTANEQIRGIRNSDDNSESSNSALLA